MRFSTLKLASLRDLLIEELRDLYNAETQLVDALPKMAEAASSHELKSAFEHHLEETRRHVYRLDSIFKQIDEKSSGETCEAMKGLVKEGEIFIKAEGDPDVRDAGLIGAAQRVEHYELAGYGTARALARRLGDNQMAEILQQTLNEEGEANKKLTSIAESQVNGLESKMISLGGQSFNVVTLSMLLFGPVPIFGDQPPLGLASSKWI